MFTAQPAPHTAALRSEAARLPARRRISAALTTAALVLAGLTLTPVAPASATTGTVNDAVSLAAAFTAGGNVTLGADITVAATDAPLVVPASPAVTLDLNGHTLQTTGADYVPGIGVPYGTTLTISDSHGGGTLTATSLTGAAGIGGHGDPMVLYGLSSGTIIITGGTVIATGGYWGAGIGGGNNSASGPVFISGGTVTATGGNFGAGIGGSVFGSGGDVTIEGGTVTATGGWGAAGIGGGDNFGTGGSFNGVNGGNVTIEGGIVTATGGTSAAGIGGGRTGNGGNVTIGKNAAVTAASTPSGPSVGITQTAIGAGETGSDFGSLSNAGTLDIPAGNVLSIPSGVTAENSGILNVAGTATGAGTIRNTGSIFNTGTITPNSLVTVNNYRVTLTEPRTPGPDATTPLRVYASTLDAVGIQLPSFPPSATHAFAGWFADAATTPFVVDTPLTADITLTARWIPQTRTVSFDSDGGTATADIPTNYGTTITKPADPTRTGHTFTGWFAGDATTAFNFDTAITEDITLTARWMADTHTVTFDSNGGGAITPISTNYGTTITAPATPERAGHRFTGWFIGDATTAFDFTTPITENITLAARWTVIAVPAGPATAPPTEAAALPSTGTDPALPLGLALVLLLAGATLAIRRRRGIQAS